MHILTQKQSSAIILTGGCTPSYIQFFCFTSWLRAEVMKQISEHIRSYFLSKTHKRLMIMPHQTSIIGRASFSGSPSSGFFFLSIIYTLQRVKSISARQQTPVRGGDARRQTKIKSPKHQAPSTGQAARHRACAVDIQVSSYVHFICKSRREEDLRHRF